jgi:hypothetical protein
MKDNPAIRQIREVRHRISAEHGHDAKRLVAYYMELQRQRRAQEQAKGEVAEPKKEA